MENNQYYDDLASSPEAIEMAQNSDERVFYIIFSIYKRKILYINIINIGRTWSKFIAFCMCKITWSQWTCSIN